MLFSLLVVVDTYEEDVARVFGYLRWIVLLLYLVNGRIRGMIELQLDDKGRLGHVTTRNHHQVSIALSCGVLTMDDILVLGPDIGDGEHTGKRVLIVVGKDTGVLVVSQVDALCHSLLVTGECGSQEIL